MKIFVKFFVLIVAAAFVAGAIAVGVFCLDGCTKSGYYPGNVPIDCKISDGYCYHRIILGSALYTDVYIWTPAKGWSFHHREDVHGVRVPVPHCENAESLDDMTCYNYSVVGHHREVDVFAYQDGEWIYVRHRTFEDK